MSTPPINILNLNDESPEYSDESEEVFESEESEEPESESEEEQQSTISVSELSEAEPSDEPEQPKRPTSKPKKNNIAETVLTMRSRVKHVTPESSEEEEKPKKTAGRKTGKFTKPKYALETVVGYKGKERVLKLVGKFATIQEIADHLQITYSKAYRIWRGHDVLSKKVVISKLEEKISRY